eukprot:2454201-Pyramimonas_sp.AAC.1
MATVATFIAYCCNPVRRDLKLPFQIIACVLPVMHGDAPRLRSDRTTQILDASRIPTSPSRNDAQES